MDRLINILVIITLIEMMVAIGMRVTFAELLAVARDWRLVMRSALANYVCVPALTVGLLLLFDARPMVAVGFLILASCPGAPYGPPFTAIAKGSVPLAVGLMVLLAGSSAIISPFLLRGLLLLVPGLAPVQVDTTRIVVTLLATQLLPLTVGMVLRRLLPALADLLQRPADLASKVLNLMAVGLILITKFPLLTEIQLRGFAGMLTLLVASCAAGWLLGGRESTVRRTMTITASLRNISVGLVVATGSFAGTPAVIAVTAYGLVSLLGTLTLALFTGAVLPPGPPATSASQPSLTPTRATCIDRSCNNYELSRARFLGVGSSGS